MKQKYVSMDNRTGYSEGSIVELSVKELNAVPYNVYMRVVRDDSSVDKALIDQFQADEAGRVLRALLHDRGLSLGRTDKVLRKYPTEALMRAGANKAGIDALTDEFLKKNFGRRKIKKGKKR